jgi:predicted RNA-binding protein YlxR (DUF448 family)
MPVLHPRKQPQRTCVSCRETQEKRALIRIVRTAEGAVAIDERGRANGRGAYLCTSPDCWRRALRTGSLARALHAQLTPEDRHTIEARLEALDTREPGVARTAALAPREGSPA